MRTGFLCVSVLRVASGPRVKLARWYTLFFLLLRINIDCEYSLEPPRRGGSNEYPQSIF